MTDIQNLKNILEALFFASNSPLSIKKIQSFFKDDENIGKKEIETAIEALALEYQNQNRSFQLNEIADGFILQTKAEFDPYLQKLYPSKAIKIAPSALEVLAIVAYRQPITRAEVEKIRGVDSSYSITQLLERQLISNQNKLDAPGQPALLETTQAFLEYFGLKNLKDLPELGQDLATTTSTSNSEAVILTEDTEVTTAIEQ